MNLHRLGKILDKYSSNNNQPPLSIEEEQLKREMQKKKHSCILFMKDTLGHTKSVRRSGLRNTQMNGSIISYVAFVEPPNRGTKMRSILNTVGTIRVTFIV